MDFIREQTKEKPISKKQLLTKIGVTALCGVVFALMVCIVLAIMVPILNRSWESDAVAADTESERNYETDEMEDAEEFFVIPSDIDLSISEYQMLQDELYKIGDEVCKSIVTVIDMASDIDWDGDDMERAGKGTGAIVFEDDDYLYILVEQKDITDTTAIRVSFVDGTGADATMLKYDANTGLAIVTAEKGLLTSETKEAVKVAQIGGSNGVKNGSLVIAVGSSILTGNITSVEDKVMTQDKNYSVYTTDIAASENGSGFLVNTNGEIIGVMMQSLEGFQSADTLIAIPEEELRGIIYNLENGKDVPYIGMYISTITDDISIEYDLPKGVFIKEVASDSPAMRAGIQNGDIITHIDGEEVLTDEFYSEKISQLIPGTDYEFLVKRQSGDAYYDVVCVITTGVFE